jgi:Zn-dependent peptidase ImmA (M78 family)
MYLQDRHPEVSIHLRTDLGTRWGQTIWRNGVPEIHLAYDLGKVQRRCTLAHELHHVLNGPPCRPLCPEDEADVIEQTARYLLPDLPSVAGAVALRDLTEAAATLNVTRNVLTERLDSLTEDEMRTFGELLAALSDPSPKGQAACNHMDHHTSRRHSRTRNHSCRPGPRRGY